MRPVVTMLFLILLAARVDAQGATSPAREAAGAVETAFREVADQVMPSVVTLRAYVRDAQAAAAPAGAAGWVESTLSAEYPGFRLRASGSGFFISVDGDVLTCLHHLQQDDGSLVDLVDVETQDQKHVIGQVIGAEPTVNLAIVRLAVFPDGLPPQIVPLRLGDSSVVRSGQWAIALGDPGGPEKFFGVGTFAAGPSRDCYQELRSAFYLQAALTAHPEAYGGPLVNLAGDVLGLLSPRDPRPGPVSRAPMGIEFALPSNIVVGLYDSIKRVGSLKSPWLGFSVMSRSELMHARGAAEFEALSKPRSGIYIENVFDPSPAFEAGVRPGDFLVRFGDADIRAPVDFQRQLYLAGIGNDARLELFRDGSARTLTLRIEERPAQATLR